MNTIYKCTIFIHEILIFRQVITLGYNIRGGNPFSTYGEYVFMIVQSKW